MHSPEELFEMVLAAMLDITNADYASILLQNPNTKEITLHAGRNLTLVMQEKLGEVIKDEIAELVLTSQQPLVAAGEGLQRFKISREVRAVVYAPMIAQGKGLGVLTVGNHKKRTEFTQRHSDLLHSMADHVAVGLVNARLFTALDHRARDTQEAQRVNEIQNTAITEAIQNGLAAPLTDLQERLEGLSQSKLPEDARRQVAEIQHLALSMQKNVHDLAENAQRPTRGIHRISPPKAP
jgi:GAF domain-containing protein